ncbi:MAG: glycosyltransferase, partial [Planctomycetota bacterium]
AEYLPEALASLRWQTFRDWECVAVDDGSTDGSAEVVERFARADPRFRLLRQEQAGITAALTRGDAAARSPLVARMDSDDVSTPGRLARQVAHLEAHPDCVAVGGQMMLVDPGGAPIGLQPQPLEHEEIERRLLHGEGGTVAHGTMTFRKEVAERVGGHRRQYEWAHDADLLVRMAAAGRLTNLPHVELLYRQHLRSSCRTHPAEIREQMLGLLEEAHAARGTELPDSLRARLRRPKRPSPLIGKWARHAARNGYARTAVRLWTRMLLTAPLSPATARFGVETFARVIAAGVTGRRGEPLDLPDWRAWDAPQNDPRSVRQSAA